MATEGRAEALEAVVRARVAMRLGWARRPALERADMARAEEAIGDAGEAQLRSKLQKGRGGGG